MRSRREIDVSGRRSSVKRYDVLFYVPSVTPLLTNRDDLAMGGAETQAFLVSRALARRGVRVCLVAFDLPDDPGAVPSSVDGVDIVVRPPFRVEKGLPSELREAARIRRALAQVRADAVVTRIAGPRVGLVALSAKLLRRRFVFSSASVLDFDPKRLSPKRRNALLYELGVRLADAIVVQTQEQVELCARFGRTPILIRSIAEPAPQRREELDGFLWIGRTVLNKQPLAYVELARSCPEAIFRMVAVPAPSRPGRPDQMSEVAQSAAELRNLELLPPRRRSELMSLIDRSVAVINTSHAEGMPNVFLEAWARGVPTLTLAHDPDALIERYGLGVSAHGSTSRLEQSARALWASRNDQREIAERCRRYVAEHHSPDAVAAQWASALGISAEPVDEPAAIGVV